MLELTKFPFFIFFFLIDCNNSISSDSEDMSERSDESGGDSGTTKGGIDM